MDDVGGRLSNRSNLIRRQARRLIRPSAAVRRVGAYAYPVGPYAVLVHRAHFRQEIRACSSPPQAGQRVTTISTFSAIADSRSSSSGRITAAARSRSRARISFIASSRIAGIRTGCTPIMSASSSSVEPSAYNRSNCSRSGAGTGVERRVSLTLPPFHSRGPRPSPHTVPSRAPRTAVRRRAPPARARTRAPQPDPNPHRAASGSRRAAT